MRVPRSVSEKNGVKIPDPKDKDSFPDCLILLRSWTVGYARERSRRGDSAVQHSHHWHASSLVARFQSVISSCIGRPPCHDERSFGPLRRQQTSIRGRRGLQTGRVGGYAQSNSVVGSHSSLAAKSDQPHPSRRSSQKLGEMQGPSTKLMSSENYFAD